MHAERNLFVQLDIGADTSDICQLASRLDRLLLDTLQLRDVSQQRNNQHEPTDEKKNTYATGWRLFWGGGSPHASLEKGQDQGGKRKELHLFPCHSTKNTKKEKNREGPVQKATGQYE